MLFSDAKEMYWRSSTAKMWKHVLGMAKYHINSLSSRPPAKGLTSLSFWVECCLVCAVEFVSSIEKVSFPEQYIHYVMVQSTGGLYIEVLNYADFIYHD